MEDGPTYEWKEADYKRASAPRMVDFMHFNALRAFDRQKEPHNISRREYVLRINERIRDVDDDDDDDVPDTTRTRNEKGDGRKQQNLQEEEEESKKESFDLDGEVVREELQRRIKWAYWLSEWNKKIKMDGKKMWDDENDPDGEAMREEFQRRLNWAYEISKKHGIAASDAAAKSPNQAEEEAAALYSS